jgi:hypothetical protein
LHPQYLDAKGLVALWREALLAQAVIAGQTRGYRHHLQLTRFVETADPGRQIAVYLRAVHAEAVCRGYRFDEKKIGDAREAEPMNVTTGQLDYEWKHLAGKLEARAPSWHGRFDGVTRPQPHPLFRVIDGGVAGWEVVSGG